MKRHLGDPAVHELCNTTLNHFDVKKWKYISTQCSPISERASPVCPSSKSNMLIKMRWNHTDNGKPKNSEKNLSQRHSVHHKSHKDWPGIESGPSR